MRRVLTICVFITLLTTPICGQTSSVTSGPKLLQVGVAIESTLSPGAVQRFDINVTEPSAVQLVVEQGGIDVVVRVTGPDSRALGEFDSPNGDTGPEDVSFIAPNSGTYSVFVSPLNQDGPADGKFEIKLQELRAASEEELKSSKNLETLKVKGLSLLDEVEEAVPQMRSVDNRIRTQLQLATLLIPIDKKRGMIVLKKAMEAVKELLEATVSGTEEAEITAYMEAANIRSQVFYTASGHDAELALDFLRATRPFLRSNDSPLDFRNGEAALESLVTNKLSSSDPKRALQLAEETLKNGYSAGLVTTVQNLRDKTPELAGKLTRQIVDKLLNEKLTQNQEAGQLALMLLRSGEPNRNRTPASGPATRNTRGPILEEADSKALLQKILSEINSSTVRTEDWRFINLLYGLKALSTQLESVAPGSSVTITRKLTSLTTDRNPNMAAMMQFQETVGNGTIESGMEAAEKAPSEIRDELYTQLAARAAEAGDIAKARQIINDNINNQVHKQLATARVNQQVMLRATKKGKFDEAVRDLSARKPSRARNEQITRLLQQMNQNVKKAAALNLLGQLRALLGSAAQAADYETMIALCELSRTYSRYDVEQAFETLNPIVDQFNELSAAARTLNGFGQKYFENDELIRQNGNPVSGLAVQLSAVIGNLALKDFERAYATAGKIRLPEIKILAYLEIAQQSMDAR